MDANRVIDNHDRGNDRLKLPDDLTPERRRTLRDVSRLAVVLSLSPEETDELEAAARDKVGNLDDERGERLARALGAVLRLYDEDTAEADERGDDILIIQDDDEQETPEQLQDVRLTNDPVKDYLRTIGRFELLTAADEVELSKAIEAGLFAEERLELHRDTLSPVEIRELRILARNGRRSYEKMFNSNLRLTVSIAKRYTGRGMQFLDLIQEGNEGMDRAIKKFDYMKGFKFSTYATWWIKQSITRAIADQGRTIRIPVHMHEKVTKAARQSAAFESTNGRQPTEEELAGLIDESVATVRAIRNIRDVISLNTPLSDDGTTEFGDLLADTTAEDIDSSSISASMKKDLGHLIGVALDDREAAVIRMRFGIGEEGAAPMTLDAVGEHFNVTRERIRQIESKAMNRLKGSQYLRDKLKDYLSA